MTDMPCDDFGVRLPTLVVAPHFDDAVLSAWALLDSERVGTVDVLTVFGGEPTPAVSTEADRGCGFADSAEAMRARRREDEAALRGVAGKAWHLPLVELQYGGLAERTLARRELTSAVERWISRRQATNPGVTIAIPAGAGVQLDAGLATPSAAGSRARGGPWLEWLRALKHRMYVRRKHSTQRAGALAHPDHVFVRDVLVGFARVRFAVTILFYEDLPYLWSGGPETYLEDVAADPRWAVSAFKLRVDRERKSRALAHYTSQLAALDPVGRRLEAPETLPEVERYWRLQRRLDER